MLRRSADCSRREADALCCFWSGYTCCLTVPCTACTGAGGLPEEVQPDMLQDDEFLRSFHHALLEASSLAT